MLWSILIATHVSRADKFSRLVSQLAPQLTPDIEALVYWNRGGLDIGGYRQALLEESCGEYVSHVDDDDRIPDYFCSEILSALSDKPDYVGFDLAFTDLTKKRTLLAQHSIQNAGWSDGGFGHAFLRDVTHLNPIRREIAIRGRFVGNRGEDRDWATEVRKHVQSEVYVGRVMYFYDFDRSLSVRGGRWVNGAGRPELPEGFRYHPKSDE